MSRRNFIIAVLLGSTIAAGIVIATMGRVPVEPRSALIIPLPRELPEFSLVDQFGEPVNADTFHGQWDLVFFGFTQCPDICPTTMQILANVKRELIDAGSNTLPRIVLVSVDPERDTPEILGRYVDYFGEGNLGVGGELGEVRKLTAALGIYFEKAPIDGDNYGVDHSAAVLVINPHGEFSALFSAPHSVANYVHDLAIVMEHN